MTTTFDNGMTATVMRNKHTGLRTILVEDQHGGSYRIPLDIAALAAGKDAWLRTVKARCQECRCETEVGNTEVPGICDECLYAEDEE